jgi:K+-transporting ATPase A subunit
MTYWITRLLMYSNFFVEGMDIRTNIPEASANPMAPTTQQSPSVTVASFISTASGISMASAILDGIQRDSAISA